MWLIVLSARFDQSLVSPVMSLISSTVAIESLPVVVGAPGVAGVRVGAAGRWSRASRALAIAASIAARCSETGQSGVRASVAAAVTPGPAGAAPLDAVVSGERVKAVAPPPPPRMGR